MWFISHLFGLHSENPGLACPGTEVWENNEELTPEDAEYFQNLAEQQ